MRFVEPRRVTSGESRSTFREVFLVWHNADLVAVYDDEDLAMLDASTGRARPRGDADADLFRDTRLWLHIHSPTPNGNESLSDGERARTMLETDG